LFSVVVVVVVVDDDGVVHGPVVFGV